MTLSQLYKLNIMESKADCKSRRQCVWPMLRHSVSHDALAPASDKRRRCASRKQQAGPDIRSLVSSRSKENTNSELSIAKRWLRFHRGSGFIGVFCFPQILRLWWPPPMQNETELHLQTLTTLQKERFYWGRIEIWRAGCTFAAFIRATLAGFNFFPILRWGGGKHTVGYLRRC
jgi:hypothetical protein